MACIKMGRPLKAPLLHILNELEDQLLLLVGEGAPALEHGILLPGQGTGGGAVGEKLGHRNVKGFADGLQGGMEG